MSAVASSARTHASAPGQLPPLPLAGQPTHGSDGSDGSDGSGPSALWAGPLDAAAAPLPLSLPAPLVLYLPLYLLLLLRLGPHSVSYA